MVNMLQSPLRFQGITILQPSGKEPAIYVQGDKSSEPYGMDALNLNYAVIGRSQKIKELSQKLVFGERPDEQTLRHLLSEAILDPALDYSIQHQFHDKQYSQIMHGYFHDLKDSLKKILKKSPIEFESDDSINKQLNDTYLSVNKS